MKFVKTVDQIAFGNHKLKNFGLASLLIGDNWCKRNRFLCEG